MRRIYTLLFSLLSFALFAQSNLVEGSITKLNGETVAGKINYREWITTPREIRFQPANNPGKTETYTADNILKFKINYKNETYQRAIVGINKESIEDRDLKEFDINDPSISILELDVDTVFLLVLVEGRINLYFLEDEKSKQHYFIQTGGGNIEELIYRRVIIRGNNNQNAFTSPAGVQYGAVATQSAPYEEVFFYDYKKQLLDVMSECPSVQADINRTLYSYTLLKLITKYNECVGELSYVKPKDKANHFLYFYAGGTQPFINLKDAYNTTPTALSASWGPSVGLGIEIGIIRSNNRLSVGLEANYARSSSQTAQSYTPIDGLNRTLTYDIDLWGLRFNGLLKYVLFKGKIKPYIEGGVGKSSYSTTKYVRTETLQTAPFTTITTERNLITSELHGIIGFGLKVNHFFLESRYESGNDINRFTGEDLKMTRLSALAGYALPLNK